MNPPRPHLCRPRKRCLCTILILDRQNVCWAPWVDDSLFPCRPELELTFLSTVKCKGVQHVFRIKHFLIISHKTLLRIPSCEADTLILDARQASAKVWLGGMPRRIKEQRKKTLIVESRHPTRQEKMYTSDEGKRNKLTSYSYSKGQPIQQQNNSCWYLYPLDITWFRFLMFLFVKASRYPTSLSTVTGVQRKRVTGQI